MIWIRCCICCAVSVSALSVSTAEAQLFGRQNGMVRCNLLRLKSRSVTPLNHLVCSPLNEIVSGSSEVSECVTETMTYTVQVPRIETKSYTVSDPSSQIKEDLKRVKEKLDTIQPGQDPSLKSLQEELREIKELLKKTTNSTSDVLRRIEVSEKIVERMIMSQDLTSRDIVDSQPLDGTLIAQDKR